MVAVFALEPCVHCTKVGLRYGKGQVWWPCLCGKEPVLRCQWGSMLCCALVMLLSPADVVYRYYRWWPALGRAKSHLILVWRSNGPDCCGRGPLLSSLAALRHIFVFPDCFALKCCDCHSDSC